MNYIDMQSPWKSYKHLEKEEEKETIWTRKWEQMGKKLDETRKKGRNGKKQKSTQKYPRVPKNTQKYPKVPKSNPK